MKLKARLSSVLTWSQFLLSWVTGVTRLSARLDCKSSLQTTKWQSNHERRPKHIGLCHKQTGSAETQYHVSVNTQYNIGYNLHIMTNSFICCILLLSLLTSYDQEKTTTGS